MKFSAVAVNVPLLPAQIETDGIGPGSTSITIGLLVAVRGLAHGSPLTISQVTTSPFFNVVVV